MRKGSLAKRVDGSVIAVEEVSLTGLLGRPEQRKSYNDLRIK
jgi:hypothetical protein